MTDLGSAIAETHVSVVVFVGDRAYKLKKPVRFGFLDLSTRESREAACRREVELNRRLAPDVYLGVLDIRGPDGELRDHLVEMVRMPDDRRLSSLLADGVDADDCLRALARLMAHFHAVADTSPEISAAAAPDAVAGLWRANDDEMRPFAGRFVDEATLDRVAHLAQRYLGGRRPLFDSRIDGGHVRDGHGDLLADDIFCMPDGPRVLDCLEFDDRLRWADTLADVAFLAMDLERLGRPDTARRFLASYREFSGESYPSSLVHHYIAYRAQVRAKVACLRAEQAGEAHPPPLLDLCRRHLEQGRVRLVVVGGLPGTGKSTLSERIATATGWDVLRSDEVRKELAGLPHTTPAPAAYRTALYADDVTERTYAELLRRAHRLLELGESVVLDASWVRASDRSRATDIAEATSADLAELHCVTGADVAAARLRRRGAAGGDASDATSAIAARMAQEEDPWPGGADLDTSGAPAESLAAALERLGAVWATQP
jgi:hypothetical protein